MSVDSKNKSMLPTPASHRLDQNNLVAKDKTNLLVFDDMKDESRKSCRSPRLSGTKDYFDIPEVGLNSKKDEMSVFD